MKPCSVCVHVCGTKRVYWTHRPHCIDLNYTVLIVCVHRLELYRPHCMCTQTCYTLLIVCVHRLELLGGNIWWTRSDCSHTTQVWEDCAVTGMVKVACEWASFCYVAVQECCSDTHCLGHLCSIFPIGCTPLKHIIHTKPHLQALPGDEATTIHSSHSSSYTWVFGVWRGQI